MSAHPAMIVKCQFENEGCRNIVQIVILEAQEKGLYPTLPITQQAA
jgi:hypothetical protein